MKKTYNNLISGIRNHFKKNNMKKAVIGLSGGIDSALSLRLLSDAIGNKNITALLMPEKGLSKKIHVEDSIGLCRSLKVNYDIIPINGFIRPYLKLPWRSKLAEMNTRARIRATILYSYANANNALVIGTSNKTELRLGYFTKYGDGAVDVEVIGDLYKTEVYQLAGYLKLPKNFITKRPSAELKENHADEDEIGETYEKIDNMLKTRKISKKIRDMINKNKHKTTKVQIIKK